MNPWEIEINDELEDELRVLLINGSCMKEVSLTRDEVYYILHLLRNRKEELSLAAHMSGIKDEHESIEYIVNAKLRVKFESISLEGVWS